MKYPFAMQIVNIKTVLIRIWSAGMALALFITLALFAAKAGELQTFDSTSILLNGQNYTLEVAITSSQRQQGLMFRKHLGAKSGMLFIYPFTAQHRIWMKNTLIPLTVIWLDNTATVIGIKQLVPCHADPCQSYGVNSPSKYVLEMPASFDGLKPGDQLPGILNI